jgi:hypothetical protein
MRIVASPPQPGGALPDLGVDDGFGDQPLFKRNNQVSSFCPNARPMIDNHPCRHDHVGGALLHLRRKRSNAVYVRARREVVQMHHRRFTVGRCDDVSLFQCRRGGWGNHDPRAILILPAQCFGHLVHAGQAENTNLRDRAYGAYSGHLGPRLDARTSTIIYEAPQASLRWTRSV